MNNSQYRIVPAVPADHSLLASLGRQTFMESHGHSGPAADIDAYAISRFTEEVLLNELADPKNLFHIIYSGETPAGYSKFIPDFPHSHIPHEGISKLERIYLLREFNGMGLGRALMNFNISLARSRGQKGIWLYVWVENHRALDFYLMNGFIIIGRHDFQISATHSNPNHLMLLLL